MNIPRVTIVIVILVFSVYFVALKPVKIVIEQFIFYIRPKARTHVVTVGLSAPIPPSSVPIPGRVLLS